MTTEETPQPGAATQTPPGAIPQPPPAPTPHHRENDYFAHYNHAKQMGIAKRALENTSNNSQIGDVMLGYGYNRTKLDLFRQLYLEAQESQSAQAREYGDRAESYANFTKLYETAQSEFSILRKIVRVVFKKDKDKLVRILADDRKKTTITGIFEQMQTCYDNIFQDQEIIAKLATVGTTIEKLEGYRKNYQSASAAYVLFYKEDSEAINATRIRDEKIEALADFMSDFLALAKIAFADQPELLKQIS